MSQLDYNLLFDKPVEIDHGIYLHCPKVEDIAKDYEEFSRFCTVFTVEPFEIFATRRDVNDLTKRFPTIWSLMRHKDMNVPVGQDAFGFDSLYDAVVQSISYWTKLPVSVLDEEGNEAGFQLLGNGKIVYPDKEWIIDEEVFTTIGNLIKDIIGYSGPDEELRPPLITSDASYKAWLNLYEQTIKSRARKSGSSVRLTDKILILSIKSDLRLLPADIMKMTLFIFNKLYIGLSAKEDYEQRFALFTSAKFTGVDAPDSWERRWKSLFNNNN